MLSAGSEHLSSFAIFIGETLVTLIALLPLLHQRVVVVRNPGLMPWQLASNSQLLPPFLKKTFRKNNPSIYFQAFIWGRVAVAADPSYPHSWTRPQDTWTPLLGVGTLSPPGGSYPPVSSRAPWPQTWRCWLSSHPLHTRPQNAPVMAVGHGPRRPTGPHHLQTAEAILTKPDVLHPPRLRIDILSMTITNRTGDKAQHPPQKPLRDPVESLLQVHKGHVDCLGKLPEPLQ